MKDKNTQEVNNNSNDSEVERYLTQMKELPEESANAEDIDYKNQELGKKEKASTAEIPDEKEVKGLGKSLSAGVIILIILNFIFIIILAFILSKLPGKAKELQTLINQELQAEKAGGNQIVNLEIENARKNTERLEALFPDERGFIVFVGKLDELKTQGYITNFSFASKEPVRDKTGLYGIPVIIELRGNWVQIGEGLFRLQNLPYLFRAVKVESEFKPLDSVIQLKYGGFLYVQENFGKD